ncbi:hypothetical protein ACC699_40315, partial [Rhizobium ruizarguesonis]
FKLNRTEIECGNNALHRFRLVDLPTKRTELSEADLQRVADVTRPTADFSKAEQYEAMQAGATT